MNFSLLRTTILSLALAGGLLGAKEKSGSIGIEKTTPVRLEQRFRMSEKPQHLAFETKDDAGLCEYQFGFFVALETEYPRFAIKNVTATISSVKIQLTLQTTLWTSKEGGAKVQAHEEAHRRICEEYYREADRIATELAQKVLGQKITVPNRDRENGFKAELERIQQGMIGDYDKLVQQRCAFAQKRFDEITDHSRKDIPVAEAIEQAMTEEKARPSS